MSEFSSATATRIRAASDHNSAWLFAIGWVYGLLACSLSYEHESGWWLVGGMAIAAVGSLLAIRFGRAHSFNAAAIGAASVAEVAGE